MIAKPPVPQPSRMYVKRDFKPSHRGSLISIKEVPHKVEKVLPESPRPFEMLQGVEVMSGRLNSFDMGLHDYLVSWAYEADKTLSAGHYRIPLSTIRRFLGPYVKREDVLEGLEHLQQVRISYGLSGGRQFIGVQMLTAWREITGDDTVIGFQFPEPIRQLMSDMRDSRFAHIELVPLTIEGMSSKFSPPLYKHLAFEASKVKWQPGEENELALELTPDQVAKIIGFPTAADGSVATGKVTAFLTDLFLKDIGSVLRFSVKIEPVQAPGRGRRILHYRFQITTNPPAMHNVRVRWDQGKSPTRHTKDDPRYAVRSDLWLKASAIFSKRDTLFAGLFNKDYFDLWKIALAEALDEAPITEGYNRDYRGPSLLMAIEEHGPTHAAWGFLCEEISSPDILVHLNRVVPREARKLKAEADFDRRDRAGLKTNRVRKTFKKFNNGMITEQEAVERYRQEKARVEQQKAQVAIEVSASIPDFAQPDEPIDWTTCKIMHLHFKSWLDAADVADVLETIGSTYQWKGSRRFIVKCHFEGADVETFGISPEPNQFERMMSELEKFVEKKEFSK